MKKEEGNGVRKERGEKKDREKIKQCRVAVVVC